MRIKELKINDWEVVRQADLEELSDFVIIAGPNGVGKTKIKNAIVHIFQNHGNPPAKCSVTLEATNKAESDSWGVQEINLPQPTFWGLFQTNQKRLKTKSRLIQIDSNRNVESINFKALSFNEIGDPENEEVGYSYGFENVKNRFKDICHTLHRLKSREVTSVYKEYSKKVRQEDENITLSKLEDPTAIFIKLFGELLHPKTMEPIDINSSTIQYKDNDGIVRNFDMLSSGEREVVVLTFDILTQNPSDCIILIDEPEVHLHPELTFRLVKVLKSIGNRNQFFLFTHSTDIIGNALDTGVHFLRPKSKVTAGNQIIKIDNSNLEGFKNIPNLRETIGMVSVGKKLLFIEGANTSIDRDVFATLAEAGKTEIAIIPSASCSNINNMALICDTLSKGIFGIELCMIRDKDGLTEEQVTNFITKSKGRLHFLPYYHIENFFLDPDAIFAVANAVLLSKAPSKTDIEAKLVYFAQKQINSTICLYVKNEIYFEAGNFDVTPKIDLESATIEQLASAINTKRDDILSGYTSVFSDDKIKERIEFWKNKLDKALESGWSEDAKKYFYGKRILKEIQNEFFGKRNFSLWEHIIKSQEFSCKKAIQPLVELLNKL